LARGLPLGVLLSSLLPAAPLRVLFLTGQTDLPYHDWRQTTPFLRDLLTRTGRFEVEVSEEPRKLNAGALAGYDVLILNYNGPRWGEEAERAVEGFVRSGKGLVAFHGVSYGAFYGQVWDKRWTQPPGSGPGWAAYADMMGVTWKPENLSHSVRHVFAVKWADPGHPIARGLEPTFLADDELYHKMDHRPDIRVIATAFSDPARRGTGKDEPVIWTVAFGRGRVLHITLGHDVKALSQPGVAAAFARGTEWAATGEVSLTGKAKP
jgi:type 1 glutamine amidotransferase